MSYLPGNSTFIRDVRNLGCLGPYKSSAQARRSSTAGHPHPLDSRRRRADATERKRQTGHARSRRDDEDETPRKTQHDTINAQTVLNCRGSELNPATFFAKRLPGDEHMPPLGRIGGPPELMPTKPGSSTPLNRARVSEESI